jgi:hypothetical protein
LRHWPQHTRVLTGIRPKRNASHLLRSTCRSQMIGEQPHSNLHDQSHRRHHGMSQTARPQARTVPAASAGWGVAGTVPAGHWGLCNCPLSIMCVRAAVAPRCSGFTIGHIDGIVVEARCPPTKDHLQRHARDGSVRRAGLSRGLPLLALYRHRR